MSEKTYHICHVVGTSKESIESAINSGLANCGLKNISWFKVTETRGHVRDNQVAYYQVSLEVGHCP